MAGLEIITAAGTVASLAGNCVQVLDRIQSALQHAKSFTVYLEAVYNDIVTIQTIAKYVHDEAVLQVPQIVPTLQAIIDAASALDTNVAELAEQAKAGGGFRKFTKALIQGPKEQLEFNRLKENMIQSKINLLLTMQASHIGFMKSQNRIIVNVVVVEKVNRWLLDELPENSQRGLNIADYLKTKGVTEDQKVFEPSQRDLQDLFGPLADPEVQQALRAFPGIEILENSSWGFGTMINGLVGAGTADLDAIAPQDRPTRIKHNTVGGAGIMINRDISQRQASIIRETQDKRFDRAIEAGLIEKISMKEEKRASEPIC